MAPNIIKNSLAALSNGSYLHTEDVSSILFQKNQQRNL